MYLFLYKFFFFRDVVIGLIIELDFDFGSVFVVFILLEWGFFIRRFCCLFLDIVGGYGDLFNLV